MLPIQPSSQLQRRVLWFGILGTKLIFLKNEMYIDQVLARVGRPFDNRQLDSGKFDTRQFDMRKFDTGHLV